MNERDTESIVCVNGTSYTRLAYTVLAGVIVVSLHLTVSAGYARLLVTKNVALVKLNKSVKTFNFFPARSSNPLSYIENFGTRTATNLDLIATSPILYL